MNLPAGINLATARLPQTYEAARTALANCARIDECKQWADRAAAIAAYVRTADDMALQDMATRIQGGRGAPRRRAAASIPVARWLATEN